MIELFELANIVAVVVTIIVGNLVKNYIIISTAKQKTNVQFPPNFNGLTGSHGIIFEKDKVASIKAEDWFNRLSTDTFGWFVGNQMRFITRDAKLTYKLLVETFDKNPNRVLRSPSKYFQVSLIESRDEDWRKTRNAVSTVLTPTKLKKDNVEEDIDTNVARMVNSLDNRLKHFAAKKEEPVIDVLSMNKDFVMETLLNVLFDTHNMVDFDKQSNSVVEEMTTFVTVNYEFIVRICFLIPSLSVFVSPIAHLFSHGKFIQRLMNILDNINKNKMNSQKMRERKSTIHSLVEAYHRGEIDEEQLKGNSLFLMMASYTTIVDLMSVFLWVISKNQDRQDKLRDDVILFGENSQYLEQCINETMRLYPPASITNRELGQTMYDDDIVLPRGALLDVNIYSIHHDPKYWGPDVEEWNPERFSPGNNPELLHPGQFLPFGLGPRNCVGAHFAKVEIMKLASQLIMRYKFEVCDKTQGALKILSLGTFPFTLPIDGQVLLKVTHNILTDKRG